MLKRFCVGVLCFFATTAAEAADAYADGTAGLKDTGGAPFWVNNFVSEFRLGGLYHDAGIISNQKEGSADVNAEILFSSPEFLVAISSPRPHLGASVNTGGVTDQVYAGLTWTYDFTDSLFGDFSFGPSVNDGHLNKSDRHRKELGSPVLFRESLSLGWRFDPANSLSVMLDHISNAGLAKYNGGMETIGLRYGYDF